MGQVSPLLRRGDGFHSWFCPGCRCMHAIPDEAGFDGNVESPTYAARFISHPAPWRGMRRWGESANDCAYQILAGKVCYYGDCNHGLRCKVVSMPELPAEHRDAA